MYISGTYKIVWEVIYGRNNMGIGITFDIWTQCFKVYDLSILGYYLMSLFWDSNWNNAIYIET